jgi:4-carboxymuconolactone decarboxylase
MVTRRLARPLKIEERNMTDQERLERGKKTFKKVYGDVLPVPDNIDPNSFSGLTMKNLFNDIWAREGLSLRDRRLVVLGALAGLGADPSLFDIHTRSALANGELTAEELREVILTVLPYAGYPQVSPLFMVVEKCIAGKKT